MFAVAIVVSVRLTICRSISRSAAQHDCSCSWGRVYAVDVAARDANVACFGWTSEHSSAFGDGRVCVGVCNGGAGCIGGNGTHWCDRSFREILKDLLRRTDVGDAGVCNGDNVRDRNRANSPAHKRLVLIATTALMVAAFARWPFAFLHRQVVVATLFSFGFLAMLILYDLFSLHNIHRATLWAGGFLVFVYELRFPVGRTAAWHAFPVGPKTWHGSLSCTRMTVGAQLLPVEFPRHDGTAITRFCEALYRGMVQS